ncbi:MAG: U32 family peptidase [Paludibacteraceae bacterium]|nr:U32 family peptidase [Paludibacteraceae bacterium]
MNKRISIELLAPARDLQVGKAAIDAGADAVYIGAPQFSARSAAGNSIEDIGELCRYAHLFDAKVLVALNTLLTEEERGQAAEMAWQVYKAGADALIVQDLKLLRETLPEIRLHASTQCDNRTLEDVLARERQGFRRAVLARELTLEEIREIRRETDIELEAFVHGALCVSYSGRCYMSEKVLGRSANRGCCAQLCRWQYDLLDKDMNELVHQKYVLSLRDLDRSRYLRELLEAGVTTLKIEGRLKDEAYVRNITAYYRQLLDRLFAEADSPWCRASKGNVYLDFTPNPEKTFHRSETDYFLHGRTMNLANWETPKSTGEYIGRVTAVGRNYIEIETDKKLNNGDGLCFADKGFLVNRVEGRRVYPNQMPEIRIGTELYRNFDIEFNHALEKSRTTRRLPVDILFKETDNGFLLRIGEQQKVFEAEKIPADNPERVEANVRTQLGKLGDTVFEASDIRIEWRQAYFIPASVLNRWRREVTQAAVSAVTSGRDVSDLRSLRDSDTPVNRLADSQPLMTCRYCILHEMDICRKERGSRNVVEPKYLRSGKNLFVLQFDCRKCEMTILPAT